MRFRDFWRSALSDTIFGFRFIVGMCVFWFGPVMFGAMGAMGQPVIWSMVAFAAVAAVGWLWAWVVILTRHFQSSPGTVVDLTPTRPMLGAAALMVGGVVGCLLSF